MGRKVILTVLGILLILSIILGVYFYQPKVQSNVIRSSNPSSPIKIDYSNIESQLSGNGLIQALPEGAVILLKFYNFNSGERSWEKSYVLKKGDVREGSASNPDITLFIHSKYISKLTNQNFCSVISEANKNGDLGTDTSLSKLSLAWKFRDVMKYKNCFGM